jgi:Raf kinase inhibitor-like YbhB/YbcL family protein
MARVDTSVRVKKRRQSGPDYRIRKADVDLSMRDNSILQNTHNEKSMKTIKKNTTGALMTLIILISLCNCSKEDDSLKEVSGFVLSSPEIGVDSLLPSVYACDGASATLPLAWSGAPEKTLSFAVIMHHVASPVDVHWYWVLYNIPASINSLPRNVSGIGTLGTNSVNDKTEYAPPCSQGPGTKAYTFTVYALSQNPSLSVTPENVTREVLLNAIEGITLSSAKMTVYYSRNISK